MNGIVIYRDREVEQIILAHHKKIFTAPSGYEWVVTEKHNNRVDVNIYSVEDKENISEEVNNKIDTQYYRGIIKSGEISVKCGEALGRPPIPEEVKSKMEAQSQLSNMFVKPERLIL